MLSLAVVVAVVVFAGIGLVGVAALLADRSETSNFSTYARAVATVVRRYVEPPPLVTEADLSRFPAPLRLYLTRAGVLGRPRVYNMRLKFHGAIRLNGASDWMAFAGEQHSAFDQPERVFYMRAKRGGLPVDGLHLFRPDDASMRIRLASLKTVADVHGPSLVQSETVTFFNDLCLFAPAALIDAPVIWEPIDARTVRGRFTLGRYAIAATLHFDGAGDLVDFTSEDRFMDAGGANRQLPWSTPVERYREFEGGIRVSTYGSGWWHPPEGSYAYIRLELDDIAYNVGPGRESAVSIPGWRPSSGDPARQG